MVTGIAPLYRDDPRLAPLIGPGAPFEVHDVVVDGIPLRDFVRAPRTIVDIFRMGAAHDDLVHVVHGDERMTFRDMRRQAMSLARELQSTFGVRTGDRVAIAMRNLPEFVVSFWGAALVGAIVVPLNSWWTGEELVYGLEDAGAVVAFVDSERLERVHSHRAPVGVQLVVVRSRDHDVCIDDLVGGAPIEESAIADLGPTTPCTSSTPRARPVARRVHWRRTAPRSRICGTWRSPVRVSRSSPPARLRPRGSPPRCRPSRSSTSAASRRSSAARWAAGSW